MRARGSGSRPAPGVPRGPRRLGLLIAGAALGAVAFSQLATGTSSAAATVLAAGGHATAASSGASQDEAASRSVRDSSLIRELNDPTDGAGGPLSAQAQSVSAQDGARTEVLIAAAAREAQEAQAARATAAQQAQNAVEDQDDGTAGPDAYRGYARSKVGAAQFSCLDRLWTRESGWRPTAQNPSSTAYGIAQLLDRTWSVTGFSKTSNGYRQVDAGLVYLKAAYGSPCDAWAHETSAGWY
jgi:hypothetical protein